MENDELDDQQGQTSGSAASPQAQGGDPAAPPAGGGGAGAGVSQPPASAALPTGAPTDDQEHSPSLGARMYHGILSALGGANDVTMQRAPDGTMQVSKVASGPGTQWKRIIAGGLAGIAGGAGAGPGPGNTTRALAGGVAGGAQEVQQQQDKQEQQADTTYQMQQAAVTRKAQLALITQQTAANAFELERRKVDAGYLDAAKLNDFHNFVSDNGGTDLGTAKDLDEVIEMHKNDPSLLKQLPQGRILATPEVQDGKVVGTRFALIPQNWENQRLDEDQSLPYLKPADKPGDKPTVEYQTVPAGTMTRGKYAAFFTSQMNEIQKQALADSEVKLRGNQGILARAAANKDNVDAQEEPKRTAIMQENADNKGATATTKAIATHNKAFVDPADNTEGSYQLANNVYNQYKTLQKKGKDFPTGAQSMLMLSQHLATTFGNVKGARVTKDMIQEHLGARSVSDSGLAALQRITNGDRLSPGQWDAFHDLISESRREKWTMAVKEAKRAKVPIDFLPQDLETLAVPADAKGIAKNGQGHIVGYTDASNQYQSLTGGK